MKVNAILLKPLDGYAPGSPRQFEQGDFERLRGMGAVREAGENDEVPPPVDEAAMLLEQFRHPVDGPRILAEMKSAFDVLKGDNSRMAGELSAMRAEVANLTALRDGVVEQRDTYEKERNEARQALEVLTVDLAASRSEANELRAGQSGSTRTAKSKTAD